MCDLMFVVCACVCSVVVCCCVIAVRYVLSVMLYLLFVPLFCYDLMLVVVSSVLCVVCLCVVCVDGCRLFGVGCLLLRLIRHCLLVVCLNVHGLMLFVVCYVLFGMFSVLCVIAVYCL